MFDALRFNRIAKISFLVPILAIVIALVYDLSILKVFIIFIVSIAFIIVISKFFK